MSDSQPPIPPAPSFEVPDLELEPLPRAVPRAAPAPAPTKVTPPAHTATQAKPPAHATDLLFGSSFDFGDELQDLEFERSAQPSFQLGGESAPRAPAERPAAAPATVEVGASWPTGRAPDPAQLAIDPLELAILADYGEPPASAPHTLAYAYRVFTRQRVLKRQLLPIVEECERAQLEREQTLSELARALRPLLEPLAEFRRFFTPLLELTQRAAERGRALDAVNAQLGAQTGQLDAELAQIASELGLEQGLAREAQSRYDEREERSKRAEAKLKRVQIEIRGVLKIAEQKLGPQGGEIPDAEAAQLASLRQRAEDLRPEVEQARAELEQEKRALDQAHARVRAHEQRERQVTRQKQALGGAYQKELSTRSEGVNQAELEQRAALADLGRAALAARGTVEIDELWLERVRRVCERADQLIVRAEMQRRAILAYDAARVRQGVRLACTALGLLLLLFAFKLIF